MFVPHLWAHVRVYRADQYAKILPIIRTNASSYYFVSVLPWPEIGLRTRTGAQVARFFSAPFVQTCRCCVRRESVFFFPPSRKPRYVFTCEVCALYKVGFHFAAILINDVIVRGLVEV